MIKDETDYRLALEQGTADVLLLAKFLQYDCDVVHKSSVLIVGGNGGS